MALRTDNPGINGYSYGIQKVVPVDPDTNAITTAQKVKIVDASGNQLTNQRFNTGMNLVGKSAGNGADFTVDYASANTLTIGNLPDGSVINVNDITFISIRNTSGVHVQTLSFDQMTLVLSGSTLTVTGFTANFASTDTFIIGTNIRTVDAYDRSLNSSMVIVQNPTKDEYDDVVLLVSAQDLTNAYADFGGEIDMRGRTKLGVWITADVNNSETVTIKALLKHTAAGTDEYEAGISNEITLWTTGASDFKKYYEFSIGAVPFVQLQAMAATVGATAGDLTISITKKFQ